MRAFLDTSALLKLYHQEEGSENVQNILLNSADEILLSELAILDFRSAFWRKVREKELNSELAAEAISLFQNDYDNFQWIMLQSDIVNSAASLLMKYGGRGLRTLDSLQLASALALQNEDCIFLTADRLLMSFLKEENLNVVSV